MYKRIVDAKLYIDANYANKIELNNISDEACFSKYHFLRLFKEAYGKSPHKYLTEVRIHHAKELLRVGESVSDTCYSVGFESLPSFTKLFKKSVGIPPSEFSTKSQNMAEEQQATPLKFVPNCFAENNGWSE